MTLRTLATVIAGGLAIAVICVGLFAIAYDYFWSHSALYWRPLAPFVATGPPYLVWVGIVGAYLPIFPSALVLCALSAATGLFLRRVSVARRAVLLGVCLGVVIEVLFFSALIHSQYALHDLGSSQISLTGQVIILITQPLFVFAIALGPPLPLACPSDAF